jgi:hypothetical protein
MSVDDLRETLSSIEASILCDHKTGKFYRMPAQMCFEAKQVYKMLGREKDLAIQFIDKQELPSHIQKIG